MSKLVTPVVVTTWHHECRHDWATSVAVKQYGRNKGSLLIYEGTKLRCTYKAGEWTKYTVQAPVQNPPVTESAGGICKCGAVLGGHHFPGCCQPCALCKAATGAEWCRRPLEYPEEKRKMKDSPQA